MAPAPQAAMLVMRGMAGGGGGLHCVAIQPFSLPVSCGVHTARVLQFPCTPSPYVLGDFNWFIGYVFKLV